MTVNKAPAGIDPRMLRFGAQPSQHQHQHPYAPPPAPSSRTAAAVPKERVLQPWEREVLDRADVKRKATVAQIYFLDYYCELSYTVGAWPPLRPRTRSR